METPMKMPLDSQLDPEKIEAILLINKMLKALEDPYCDDASREVLLSTLGILAKTYTECVDNTEN